MELDPLQHGLNGLNAFANPPLSQAARTRPGELQDDFFENADDDNSEKEVLFCSHTEPPDPSHTCYHPYHSVYSETNLPLVLFRLDPPEQDNTTEITLLLENDECVLDHAGRPVRDFTFLPRYISSRPPAWLMEYWMRTDSRLTYRDIKARMTSTEALPSDNVLNMRREREARMPLGLSCWTARRGDITKAEIERVERLTTDQVAFNTTMLVEYAPLSNGHQKIPVSLLSKSIKSSATHRYPLQTFVNGDQQMHTPSLRLQSAIELLFLLQDTATSLDLENWRDLPTDLLPEAWLRRASHNKKNSTTEHGAKSKRANTKKAVPRRQTFQGQGTLWTPNGNNTNTMVHTGISGRLNTSYAENVTRTTHVNTPQGPSLIHTANTPINPFADHLKTPTLDANRSSQIALAALSKIEPSAQRTPDGLAGQNSRKKEMPIDPRILFDCDPMDIDGAAERTVHHIDPSLSQFNRFNNNMSGFSLRSSDIHCVHSNTPHVMGRNDPFMDLRQPSITAQRSFERYLMEDVRDDQDIY